MKRGGWLPRYTELARGPMKRGKRSVAKQDAKFAREFGSPERAEWITTLPCIVPGCPRTAENAHVVNIDGGMSRKSHFTAIAPICHLHHSANSPHALHKLGPQTFERLHHLSLAECARRTAAAWDARGGREC